jgi:flagellar assembly protein FliH
VRWENAETDVTRLGWRPGGLVADAAEQQQFNSDEVKQALLSSAMVQSQQILQSAREQAGEFVRGAREQAAEITRQAKLEGLQAADAETAQLLLSAHGVLDEVQAWRTALLARSERPVLDLVAAVARRMFGNGLVLEPAVLQEAFNRALAEAKPLGALRVHLNPDDAKVLGEQWTAAVQANSRQQLELVPDAAIRRGGCLIESDYGQVDARVDSQLQIVLDTFDGVARTEPAA